MSKAIVRLPEGQLAPLLTAYRANTSGRRRAVWFGLVVVFGLIVLAGWVAEVNLRTFFEHIGAFTSYFDRIATLDSGARVWTNPAEWLWGWSRWLRLLVETLLMSYVGTLLGAVFAFLLCFLCSANMVRDPATRFAARRLLEFCRTVPDIVFALIFVVAFGLGPLPGVLAILIHTMGALGKQFAEVVENVDMKPVEGLTASGGNWVQTVRFAVVPQVISNFVSYTLLRFEINVRGASVLGFVGAGGIGQDLIEAIRKFYYSDVSAILAMIVVTVFTLDLVTERIRHRLLSAE